MKLSKFCYLMAGFALLSIEKLGFCVNNQETYVEKKVITCTDLLDGKLPIPVDGKIDSIMMKAYEWCLMKRCMSFRKAELRYDYANPYAKAEIKQLDDAIIKVEKSLKVVFIGLKAAYHAFTNPVFTQQMNEANWESNDPNPPATPAIE